MRLLLFLLGISVLVVINGNCAEAQNYPCARNIAATVGMNCGFTTFQQCLADASGIGGFCRQNSTYQPPQVPRPRARRTRSSLR
jgi:Protein of unknown function (DUF3551)